MFYVINLLVYGAVDAMACLGLSQQFGIAGVTNFGFIIFQAAGAYAAAVLSLPPDNANGGFQSYVGGWSLPFPLPWIGAAVVGGLLALPFTFLVGRRLRGDFAAVGLLVTAVLVNLLVTNYRPFMNGDAGLAIVPAPLQGELSASSTSYQLMYAAGAIAAAGGVYWFVHRITESPYGRTLRAMRDNDRVADSIGKNLLSLRTGMLVVGGVIAGLSGAVLVGFINTWSPAAWTYAETIVLFAAVIIGGAGNHRGAILGALLVPLAFEEGSRFIPNSQNLPPNLIPSLQWVAIGLLIALFLWFRPQGLLPERKRLIALPGSTTAGPGQASAATGSGPEPGTVPEPGTTAAPADAPAPAAPATAAPRQGAGARLARREPGPAVPAEILKVDNVSRSFGGVHAASGVSFSVQRGTFTGLIGPNGAGKSTLLALLAGTDQVSGGKVLYQGDDVTGLPAYRRARIGLIRTFQLASEFKRLTVLENLLTAAPGNRGDSFRGAVAGQRYWRSDEDAAIARAETVLRQFGLTGIASSYAGDLSGGQRRLVEIMRALMAEPEILLLDEPMAGVHRDLARRIGSLLTGLCRDGLTVLMVEHELSIVDEFCDPVVVMAEGSILAQGTMAELRQRTEVVEAYLVG
ncbi:MAG: branched-chain amino acid ABC transporter ATP-binding protein/permease [Actinomycetota bacterium]